MQFHLSDGDTAADNLKQQLQQYLDEKGGEGVSAVLLFDCLGRGQGLYGAASRDSELISQSLAKIPIFGFFANGEIGPLKGMSFQHGFSAVLAIIRQT